MPVTAWLKSGEQRIIAEADGADRDGMFLRFTANDRRAGSDRRTVLTLRAADIARVEIENERGLTKITIPGGPQE